MRVRILGLPKCQSCGMCVLMDAADQRMAKAGRNQGPLLHPACALKKQGPLIQPLQISHETACQ